MENTVGESEWVSAPFVGSMVRLGVCALGGVLHRVPPRPVRRGAPTRRAAVGLCLVTLWSTLSLSSLTSVMAQHNEETGPMVFEIPDGAQFEFGGVVGRRTQANIDNWLLRAPIANPGMLEMFRRRDRKPVPDLVPWAGEFVGKYLISAIQACRMTDDPRLRPFVAEVVAELISTQAEDGYLGPFRRDERLLGHWDLWGHYHAMLALLMWHEDTGDRAALQCAARMGDLMCKTFPDGGRRVHDAGSQEMNMAVIHSLGRLYRHTDQERYLRLMRQIVQEWQMPPAGDYLRTGLDRVDFYRTPKPRWESLHDLQGLVEMYQITGAEQYRTAFIQHWSSIRNYDRHPSGGFTTGERAVGNPYSQGAIETCCTTAWMALTVDMLRLTGDAAAADELELATWNSMLGSQHPSGRWWTYDTPLDGVRQASAHHIVFQSRFGTPELNCCSVNAPRGLGMLSEWAVMAHKRGPVVNFYGPCEARMSLEDGTPITLVQQTAYPADGRVRIRVGLDADKQLALRLRIPGWSRDTAVAVNGSAVQGVVAGEYLMLDRLWHDGDIVELSLDMSLRSWTGELGRQGAACLYAGPILLAFDQKFNTIDVPDVPTLDLSCLQPASVRANCLFRPLVLMSVKAQDGTPVVLCDFATAGAHGTDYRAWLPAVKGSPACFHLKSPPDRTALPAGPAVFEWTGYFSSAASGRTFTIEIAADPAFKGIVARKEGIARTTASMAIPGDLSPHEMYYWRVVAHNEHGATQAGSGPWSFEFSPELPNESPARIEDLTQDDNGAMVVASLDGTAEPGFGTLLQSVAVAPAADRRGDGQGALAFDGATSGAKYEIAGFPADDYSVTLWACPGGPATDRLQEVFSAWAAPMDDPLRIVIDKGQVFARMEAGAGYSTQGVPLAYDKWIHLTAVKQGERLSLYVNGELKSTAEVPAKVFSAARDAAIGTNPNYSGNECLLGKLDEFVLYARALSQAEVVQAFRNSAG